MHFNIFENRRFLATLRTIPVYPVGNGAGQQTLLLFITNNNDKNKIIIQVKVIFVYKMFF